MTRLLAGLVFVALAAGLWPAAADDPPKKLTPEERKELEAKWKERTATGSKAYPAGKYAEATTVFREALDLARVTFPAAEFPDGHPMIAASLNNLAVVSRGEGRLTDAALLYREALAMRQRVFKG